MPLLEAASGLVFECVDEDDAQFLYAEIFHRRVYDRWLPTLKGLEGPLVVDAGANIGLFSLRCAQLAGQETIRMLAAEPVQAVFDVLGRNLASLPHAVVVRAALAADDGGHAVIACFADCPSESTRYPEERAAMRRCVLAEAQAQGLEAPPVSPVAEFQSCPRRSLASLLREHFGAQARVHLLKVDVEGDELDVLKGVGGHADWARVDQVVVEVQDPTAGAQGEGEGRLQKVVALLRSEGGFQVIHVERQQTQVTGPYLSFVPEALGLWLVAASRVAVLATEDEAVAGAPTTEAS